MPNTTRKAVCQRCGRLLSEKEMEEGFECKDCGAHSGAFEEQGCGCGGECGCGGHHHAF